MRKDRRKKAICIVFFAFTLCLSVGCAQSKAADATLQEIVQETLRETAQTVPQKPLPTATAPAATFDPASIRMPEATGKKALEKNGAHMDASNAAQGYVMVRCDTDATTHKVSVSTSEATYYYTLPKNGSFITCPLQMGDGRYTVQVYEQLTGTQYSPLCKWTLDVTLDDEAIPYLYPNQFVDYTATDEAVRVSFQQSADAKTDRDKAEQLFTYVAREIDYDYDKAANVQEGYLPSPDRTLSEKKGICFDYAALLATMLRVQDIPARLQMGELSPDNIYHAWNLVCIDDLWYLMDATLYGQGYKDENYTAVKNY